MSDFIKLSELAFILGMNYKTVLRYFHNGQIPGAIRLPSGSIRVPRNCIKRIGKKGVIKDEV